MSLIRLHRIGDPPALFVVAAFLLSMAPKAARGESGQTRAPDDSVSNVEPAPLPTSQQSADLPKAAQVDHTDPMVSQPPTQADTARLASTICERVCKMLLRRGLIGEATYDSNEPEHVDGALDACRRVALTRGRFERIDEQGRSQQHLFPDDGVAPVRNKNSPWVGEHNSFSLHAGVSFGALDRKGREKLGRYCVRPAICLERLSVLRDGAVAYNTKWRTRSGATHRLMRPMECVVSWPGNVRELEHRIERMVALSLGGAVDDEALAAQQASKEADDGFGLKEKAEAFERGLILQSLRECGGNRSETARQLGIGRVPLLDKMKKYAIE